MVRTRKAIYVGNQEVKRRYIGNKLTYVNLDDVEDRDKVSGTEIFTDKADNSVVHVEIDGKSYQDGVPTPEYPIEIHSLNDFDVVSSTEKLSEGQLEEYNHGVEYENIYKINLLLDEPLRSVEDVKDRVFRDSDDLWKVERSVGEVTCNGSENWTVSDAVSTEDTLAVRVALDFQYLQHLRFFTNLFLHTNDAYPGLNSAKITSAGVFMGSVSKLEFPSIQSWREYLINQNLRIVRPLLEPIIETLDQELQDKLNNLRSFQDSNYVYTVINDISPTVAENLNPTLHTTFKSKGWYDYYLKTLLQ